MERAKARGAQRTRRIPCRTGWPETGPQTCPACRAAARHAAPRQACGERVAAGLQGACGQDGRSELGRPGFPWRMSVYVCSCSRLAHTPPI